MQNSHINQTLSSIFLNLSVPVWHEICEKLTIEKDLLQRAIQRKLRLFCHICRMDGGQQEVKDTDVWNCRWNE